MKKPVPLTTLTHTWLRTFLIQASFNYDRMIGVGVAYAATPIIRTLDKQGDAKRATEVLGRASQHFNAHPYLAAIGIGAVARVEHDGVPTEKVERMRKALTGPLGAIGDRLVWAGALPVASSVALLLAAFTNAVIAVVAFLVLFNVVHLTLRSWGLVAGWRAGERVVNVLRNPVLQVGLRVAGPAAALSLGLALPIALGWSAAHLATGKLASLENLGLGASILVVGAVGFIIARWVSPSLRGVRFGLAVVLVAALAGML